jgi:hypothetical protein
MHLLRRARLLELMEYLYRRYYRHGTPLDGITWRMWNRLLTMDREGYYLPD